MPILYHYCSNASFLSIIATHKVWASEFTLSNDLLEGKWIREVVQKYCKEKNVSWLVENRVLQKLDALISFIGAAGICLSQEGDLLSQWRAYSENGSGVSIGFDQSCFGVEGSPLPSLQQVIYDPVDQMRLIRSDMERIFDLIRDGAGAPPPTLAAFTEGDDKKHDQNALDVRLATAVLALFPHLYILKNPAFQEEKEWRTVSIVIAPNDPSDLQSEGSGVYRGQMNFRALPDRIVPYREFLLVGNPELSVIREVILGPRNVTPVGVVEAALLRHGWKGVRVTKSAASYR